MKPVYKQYLKKVGLIWMVFFVLFVLGYVLVLAPQNRTAKQVKGQLVKEEKAYNLALKSIEPETKLKLNKKIDDLRKDLQNFAVDSEYSANLPFDITRVAKQEQIDMVSIRTQSSEDKTNLPDCDYIYENCFNLDFSANFNQFATFLNALERHRPVIFVDECVIERSKEENSPHSVGMTLSVFVRKPNET